LNGNYFPLPIFGLMLMINVECERPGKIIKGVARIEVGGKVWCCIDLMMNRYYLKISLSGVQSIRMIAS